MSQRINETDIRTTDRRSELILPIAVVWCIGLVVAGVFLWTDGELVRSLGDYYLIPWTVLTTAILLAPSGYLYYKGQFDPFHPLVYAAWGYLLIAFVGGALVLTFKLTDPYFLAFIEDPEYNLPLSLVYVSIGFIGLTAGYCLPVGKYLARNTERVLPKKTWTFDDVWLPGFALILLGIGLSIIGLLQGLLGYQRVDEIGNFDTVLVFMHRLFILGYLLLWMGVFGQRRATIVSYGVVAFLVLLVPFNLVILGNRSSLLLSTIPVGVAYWYSGRKLKWAHGVVFGGLLFVAVFAGIIYGTTFRSIKGSEARMAAGDYATQVVATLDYLSKADPADLTARAAADFAERIENLSSLAVVVSNYEKLEPYEESYGIKNNIVNEFLASFIPRFMWPDKPLASNARGYSELYFDFGENSFAITVFGDLLRNFGPVGIPIGMVFLGIFLRFIYDLLIATPEPRIWKVAAYYPVLVLVHYEGFYSSIFPNVLRVAAVIAVGLLAANLLTRRKRQGI